MSEFFKQERLGAILIGIGVAGMFLAVILGLFASLDAMDFGPLAAVSFFVIMLGMVFYFPDLLKSVKEGHSEMSTMRVVVFIVVCVFSISAIRIGWHMRSFDEFRVDPTWIYILGLAFGAKVFQKYSEESK